MLTQLSEWFYRHATGRRILTLFALLLLFLLGIAPLAAELFPESTNGTSLDAPVAYAPEQVFAILDSWGAAGRRYQLFFHFTWDLAVPVLGLLFLGFTLSWLFRRAFPPASKMRLLNLAALACGFDLLENVFIASLIVTYPARIEALAWLKAACTVTKYAFGPVLIALLVGGLALAARNRFKVMD